VLEQVERAIDTVRIKSNSVYAAERWIENIEHYLSLLRRVIDQTQRRVYKDENVPAEQKIVSQFEEHTDIIVKGKRDGLYRHKGNCLLRH